MGHKLAFKAIKQVHKFAEDKFIAQCKEEVAQKQAELDQLKSFSRQMKMTRQK